MKTTEHLHPPAPSAPAPLDPWRVERPAATGAALVERRGRRRGEMAPLYERAEDETFRVLAGELTFFVGGEVVRAAAEDVVVAPGSVARTYRVETDDARWLVLTRVSSVGRYEDFGRALAQPLAAPAGWPAAEEEQALTAIAAANGIRVLGPPGLLPHDA